MANVAFKQGSQAALNSIAQNKGGQEGSFYLTSDSHRLYRLSWWLHCRS